MRSENQQFLGLEWPFHGTPKIGSLQNFLLWCSQPRTCVTAVKWPSLATMNTLKHYLLNNILSDHSDPKYTVTDTFYWVLSLQKSESQQDNHGQICYPKLWLLLLTSLLSVSTLVLECQCSVYTYVYTWHYQVPGGTGSSHPCKSNDCAQAAGLTSWFIS